MDTDTEGKEPPKNESNGLVKNDGVVQGEDADERRGREVGVRQSRESRERESMWEVCTEYGWLLFTAGTFSHLIQVIRSSREVIIPLQAHLTLELTPNPRINP